MATTSVAMPPQPGGDEEPLPAMLDRVRGLAAGASRIQAAQAQAQAQNHNHNQAHQVQAPSASATGPPPDSNSGGGVSGVVGGGGSLEGGGVTGGPGLGFGPGGGSSSVTRTGSSARLDAGTAALQGTTRAAGVAGAVAGAVAATSMNVVGTSAGNPGIHASSSVDAGHSSAGNSGIAVSGLSGLSGTRISSSSSPSLSSASLLPTATSSSSSSSPAASRSSKPSHRHTQSGRITKPTRPRPTPCPSASSSASSVSSLASSVAAAAQSSSSSSSSSPPSSANSSLNNSASSSPPLQAQHSSCASSASSSASSSRPSTRPRHTRGAASYSSSVGGAMSSATATATATATPRSQTATATAMADTDPPVLSFWGPDPVPLPSRFARIKRNLIKGHEAELEASWKRIIRALRAEVEHIEGLGAHLIPSIEFSDIDDPAQNSRFGRDLRRYGVGVVRKVMPKTDADNLVHKTVNYLEERHGIKPLEQDPTCYDFFWTPAQVLSRANPNVLRAQKYMMSLWETNPEDRLASKLPITYVDRIRIHGATDQATQGLRDAPAAPPQSADDWITQLQSSAGIIAQVDNGSLERWEPDGYQRGGTYDRVFHGQWEDYDPWECASRVSSTTDLYNGYAACTIFRMFQGVLALSTIEPGMIRLLPSPKLATAYYLLRPFFSPRTPMPRTRSGPAWESYLAPDNWRLERDPDTIIHGAVPGHAQRITENWHPHLHLRSSMITLPTLQPGDYIFWHPDLPYHISSNNPGLKTPSSIDDISMLVYIPAAPLTQTNALYLARQRRAFQRGHPGPDFDSSVRSLIVEDKESEFRITEKDIAEVGGVAGLQAMGLAPWETASTRAGTPPPPPPRPLDAKEDQAKDDEMETETETENKSQSSSSSASHAEAEVVRLSNIILFPDRSMMGYSV